MVSTRPGMFRAAKVVALGSLLLLGGCSSTAFLYNRLDLILPWYLGEYVDLDRSQKKQLKSLLEPFLEWHRSEELPAYLEILAGIEATLDEEVAAEDVAAIASDFEQAWFRLEARAIEWMLVLGEGLSDQQIAEFVQQLQDKQREYEEEYLQRDDEKYQEDAFDNLYDNSRDYLGRLNAKQREGLEQAAGELQRADRVWLEERADWMQRLEVMLQREPGWQQAILDALAARDDTVSEEYLAVYQHNTAVVYQAIADLLNSRTEKQDQRLRRKLTDLRQDIEGLITQ